jgi:uncharacterized repeat protein (TIGR03803 family)
MKHIVVAAILSVTASACAGLDGSNYPGIRPQAAAAVKGGTGASYQTIFTFDGIDGADPDGTLLYYDGKLYGTTKGGGAYEHGTVFSTTPGGKEKVLHSFGNGTDGREPEAGLTIFKGTLYGTTYSGGNHDFGSVFSISPTGKNYRVLHRFGSPDDAENPTASFAVLGGVLYGTSSAGGIENGGTVYSITPKGHEQVLYRFKYGARNDGDVPFGGLVAVGGTLYGTTAAGGKCYGGTIYSITTTGKETVLYDFYCQNGDGDSPEATLLYRDGIFYGTTMQGGKAFYNDGTVFSFTLPHTASVLYEFLAGSNAARPESALVAIKDVLYGTSVLGGASYEGTVFSLMKTGEDETVVHSFGVPPDGATPLTGLTDVSGTLFGTASAGGRIENDGTIFKVVP